MKWLDQLISAQEPGRKLAARDIMPSEMNTAFSKTSASQPEPSPLHIPPQHAQNFILRAFMSFGDDDLECRIGDIMRNRTNLRECLPGQEHRVEQCRPAGLTIEDVKQADMYMEDFAEKYGPDVRQDNPGDRAEIDLDYDGTIHALVYWAHEIGHALADDIGQEAGFTYKDTPLNTDEIQGYYGQIILYDGAKNQDFPRISEAVEQHFQETLTLYAEEMEVYLNDPSQKKSDRPAQFLSAVAIYQAAKNSSPETRNNITSTVFGANGPKTPEELLELAGITSQQELLRTAKATPVTVHAETSPAPVALS